MSVADAINNSFLGALDPSLADSIRQRAIVHHHRSGDTVVSDADADWTGIVLSGMARVFLRTESGRQVTLRHARPGSSIGIAALFGDTGISAQAVTDCEVMRLDAKHVLDLAQAEPSLAVAIAKEMSIRLMETYREIVAREQGTVRQRLAGQLLHFVGQVDRSAEQLVIQMSHEQLADAVGSAREVVSRQLARFQAEEIVALERGRITLVDPVRLELAARHID
jgi:CRP/FNR family transcriptional regulator